MLKNFGIAGKQIVIHSGGAICANARELLQSEAFETIVGLYADMLVKKGMLAVPLDAFCRPGEDGRREIVTLIEALSRNSLEQTAKILPAVEIFLTPENRRRLHEFIEGLYDFWRSYDRFMILNSMPGPSSFDQRPYRSFNATVETLTHLVRAVYRDVCENVTGDHPRVYRQVAAGCDVALTAVPQKSALPEKYAKILGAIPMIRQVWIRPPLIIDPPMNKRTGQFAKAADNPLDGLALPVGEWVCYPAQVGPLTIFVYFHQRFIGLGCALANLFEIATDEQIANGPDAVYAFGVPPESMKRFGELPTVFYDDPHDDVLVACVPGEDRFGYFGYLKKMILTLHNIAMMKRGRMPFHGAMVRVVLKTGRAANILIIGDTATGKSETLEAFRTSGDERIGEMRVIADDMGSLDVTGQTVLGYGTEIGAFIRLDDLQQGYAFGQIDRAIIMSPQKINARVVLPVTTIQDVLRGHRLDFILYANNYEHVDDRHPVVEKFDTCEEALAVFGEGAAMAKGTTTASGLVHSYFANIFGPPQYRERHEPLAKKTFETAFADGVFVGELRTRLGVPGFESSGPEAAARALLDLLDEVK